MDGKDAKYQIFKVLLEIKCEKCPLREACDTYEEYFDYDRTICSLLENQE